MHSQGIMWHVDAGSITYFGMISSSFFREETILHFLQSCSYSDSTKPPVPVATKNSFELENKNAFYVF